MGTKLGKEPDVMLAPNATPDLEKLHYPVLSSVKLDGIRGIIKNGEMLTRKMEPFKPMMIHRFQRIIDLASELEVVLDFEVWSPSLSFTQISSAVSSANLCSGLKLYIFDVVDVKEWYNSTSIWGEDSYKFFTSFNERYVRYRTICKLHDKEKELIVPVKQHLCLSAGEVKELLDLALAEHSEGLMLKSPTSFYLHGRCTEKQGIFWKLKKWVTQDAKIVGFKQKTILTNDAKENNIVRDVLGNLKRGHRKGDRVMVDEVGSVEIELIDDVVFPKGTRCFVGFTEEAYSLRKAITWESRHSFVDKHVEIVFQEHGAKDKPRMGRIVRLRPDRD
jgi:DNA ligase-1